MLKSIVRYLAKRNCPLHFCHTTSTHFSTETSSIKSHETSYSESDLVYSRLTRRSVIKLEGVDIATFLHGLVTNDVKHYFTTSAAANSDLQHLTSSSVAVCLYTFMLNTQGRILYDLFLYGSAGSDRTILIECDTVLLDELVKTLRTYRMRRKIQIDRSDQHVLAVFSKSTTEISQSIDRDLCSTLNSGDDVLAVPDPRVHSFAVRVLQKKSDFNLLNYKEASEDEYDRRRYSFGLAEGSLDLPSAHCLPLEANGDYVNGVSFHKGCYIGQELTARTHHTGVVRKRLMPLFFDTTKSLLADLRCIPKDAKVFDENQQIIGRFKNVALDVGLGLMRVDETMKAKRLHIQVGGGVHNFLCSTHKPKWWPDGNLSISGQVHVNATHTAG